MTHPKGTVPKLISENNALRHKVSQLEKLLSVKDLEIGATRNLLGAVIVAEGGSVNVGQDLLSQSYQLDSADYDNSWTFTASVVEATFDVVPSELSAGNADTDNPATTIE